MAWKDCTNVERRDLNKKTLNRLRNCIKLAFSMFGYKCLDMLNHVLLNFGLNPSAYTVEPFGTGLINRTFKLSGENEAYILQCINGNIFKSPGIIAGNMALLSNYFKKSHPEYLFVGPLPALSGDFLVTDDAGDYYRLFPFVKGSQTIEVISEKKEAYEAAAQFARFTFLLQDFDAGSLTYTLADFHNLHQRFMEFSEACKNAKPVRRLEAAEQIKLIYRYENILQTYKRIITDREIPLRVIHHDTKISNILFDDEQNGLCVIDLDTVMAGYYISDVGDMMRTYLSPANEEETDLSKISIRTDIFEGICKGYLSQMGGILTRAEKDYFIFAGEMMIYMQAMRFLTDFLNNDIYYGIKYPLHNLSRARNQFELLRQYLTSKETLKRIFETEQKDFISFKNVP